jgi:DEAD/DEAH box helicase domain-containing protein
MGARRDTGGGPPEVQRRLKALFREGGHEQVVAVAHEAARTGRPAPLPDGLPAALREALGTAGITQLYGHQRAAYDLLAGGHNVVVSTGTASGKSLCYQLAVLAEYARDPQSRALLLFPTKALAQDQARKLAGLRFDREPGGAGMRPAVPAIYDGDTPMDTRATIRRTATILLSNPDMLHLGILPGHERWAEFLYHLRYIVLDEAHVYRGVFGSHVAQVVRRLRRLCAHYGGGPQFVLTSATIAEPQAFAERLVGVPFTAVDDDQAPRPERTVVFWNPPLEDPAAGTRRSALAEASYVTAESVLAGARVIAFAPTRKAAELIYGHVRRRLEDRDPGGAATRVQPYRAGYTPQQRRDIERRLFSHELDAVVATQALELGIDVGSLDVSLVTGFPGTVTSLRQRWGRAGRKGHGWAVLVGGQDALDQYFMREPELLLSRRVEEAIIDLHNAHISARHLEAAAYERPLTAQDETYFGEEGMLAAVRLADAGRLRRHADGLVWSLPHSPAAETSLRTAGREQFVIVERRSGELIGTLEHERVFRFAHPGAVYLHLGRSYLVTHLDLAGHTVLVEEFDGTFYTQAKVDKNVLIAGQANVRPLPGAPLFFGDIEVTEQVIAYQRRDLTDQHVIDTTSLDLPEQTFTTQAFWLAVPGAAIDRALGPLVPAVPADGPPVDVPQGPETLTPGSLHAAEHALIALLPLYAMCDRWDIGGLSTPWHWQTDAASIFVYDGYPGGIGLARRGFDAFESLAADAATLVAACPCESGCPSCVQSPKCGNLNEPLHKAGSVALLRALLEHPPPETPGA